MKKTIIKTPIGIYLFFYIVGTSSLLGQGGGTFYFGNFAPPDVDAPVFDSNGNRLEGTNYLAMLFGGPTIGSLSPAFDESGSQVLPPIPFTYAPTGVPGYFDYPGYVRIAFVVPGDAAWLQVVAWDARLGAAYQDVVNLGVGGYGESPLFQAVSGGAGTNPTLPADLIGLQSFSLLPVVPEPSPAWLWLLGLPLLFWRKRFSRSALPHEVGFPNPPRD